MQPGILSLGFLQDWYVRGSVFPKGEKIFVGCVRSGLVSRQRYLCSLGNKTELTLERTPVSERFVSDAEVGAAPTLIGEALVRQATRDSRDVVNGLSTVSVQRCSVQLQLSSSTWPHAASAFEGARA